MSLKSSELETEHLDKGYQEDIMKESDIITEKRQEIVTFFGNMAGIHPVKNAIPLALRIEADRKKGLVCKFCENYLETPGYKNACVPAYNFCSAGCEFGYIIVMERDFVLPTYHLIARLKDELHLTREQIRVGISTVIERNMDWVLDETIDDWVYGTLKDWEKYY